MAHAFKKIPAKPAFGTLNQVGFQSDYISNKKNKIIYQIYLMVLLIT